MARMPVLCSSSVRRQAPVRSQFSREVFAGYFKSDYLDRFLAALSRWSNVSFVATMKNFRSHWTHQYGFWLNMRNLIQASKPLRETRNISLLPQSG
jgi:hypothetical protein